jgi:aspartyl-tRNA(Asn)/glutamyl-tRNA(Gln) amidotransferase subunit A
MKKRGKVVSFIEDLKNGATDPYAYVERALEEASRKDPVLNIFITMKSEVPDKLVNGKLAGVPIAVKDNIVTKGLRTTCASRILENFVPQYSATIVKILEREGAVIIGKTNMDEFAMGALGTTSAFGPTLNPINTKLSPGGSSSGSAAAVASGVVDVALGSDTGGSIRLPAAWTGIFGLKPTYGAVSRFGLISYADSMDQIGPMSSNASDLAYLFSIISSFDPLDPTSSHNPWGNRIEEIASKEPDFDLLRKLKLKIPRELLNHPQAEEYVIEEFWGKISTLEKEGAQVEEISEPILLKVPQVYYVIAFSEASSNLARFDGVRYGSRIAELEDNDWDSYYMMNRSLFGWEVKRRIMLGAFILSKGYYEMYYSLALKARAVIKRKIESHLKDGSLIATPGSLISPLPINYDATDLSKLNAIDAPLMIANLGGFPAVTVPTGSVSGTPTSMQFVGPSWSEDKLLSLAKVMEEMFT